MTDYISAELAATCDALGYCDGASYHLDADAFNVIKDLIKYLKRDDDSHTVRRYLGQTKLLETDLIQIAIHHSENEELWDVLLRLIINLTSPALMVYNEEIPTEKTSRNLYLQLIGYLQSYKKALTDDGIWKVNSARLRKILDIDPSERGEENSMIIERILTFIRNVLQVPPDDNEKRTNTEATVHDEVLFALHTSGIVDLLLFMSSNSTEQQYHMQILEIIALMLREQNARTLATTGMQRTIAEKEREEAELLAIRRREIMEKVGKMKKYSGSRHSRFGGTFVVENMKAIGDNQLICYKPFQQVEALEFTRDKPKLKKAKNKVLIEARLEERTSALSVRLFLKEICVEFLNAAYNSVMRYAKSCIIGGNHPGASDASYFFWTLRFFMEFNRNYKFQVKYVSETISTEIFYLTQRQMEQNYEMLITDKKKNLFWSRRLHVALKAYQELLHTLNAMDRTADKGVRESSKVIKSNVFYVPEYRETILSQLLCYDGLKMSRDYLVDLVTTAHIFLKMLEQFCNTGRNLVVAKAKPKRRKNIKSKNKTIKKDAKIVKTLEEKWDDAGPELSAVMQDGVIPTVVPFDATSDTPIDEQKSDAMKRIQKLLRRKEFEVSVGLLRAAREVWPENDCFGKLNMPVEEEFLALREIFFADLGVAEELEAEIEDQENVESFLNNEDEADKRESDEEDEEEESEIQYEETNFNYDDFLKRFVNVKIVKAMTVLLRNFEENTLEINHSIVKMLHRIAWNCKMPAMIFQASIFRIFQRVFESKLPEHRELQKFATFIIRQFAEAAEKNRKAYMELLFWKNSREATEMVEGYDVEPENKKLSRASWTEAEEDELRTLFMEHQTNKYTQDLIDWLHENIISDNRTQRGIMKKLKEMHLIVGSKRVRDEVQKRLPKEWSEAEITQLTELWNYFKDDLDPVDLIHGGLRIKRPKSKVKEKLLELGLAKDKKELRKKRKKETNGRPKSSWEARSETEESSNNSDSDEEASNLGSKSTQHLVQGKKKTTMKKKTKKQPTIVYSDAQLSGLLKVVINEDMKDALEWIKESLEEALEDRDEESAEGIPLVPVSDDSSTAMDSPSFQRLLRAIGIEPPSDEQEAYWRIPSTMLGATIRKRCELIVNSLDGNFITEDPINAEEEDSDSSDNENDGEKDLEKIKKLFNTFPSRRKKTKQHSIAEGSDSSSDENTSSTKTPNKSIGHKLTPETESSGSDGGNKTGKSKLNESRIRVMQDSSDSEMEMDNSGEKDPAEVKRHLSENSDTETPTLKKRRVIDSDDDDDNDDDEGNEEDTPKPEKRDAKQSRKIVSDSEDD